jgi:hypothetical protein
MKSNRRIASNDVDLSADQGRLSILMQSYNRNSGIRNQI